MTTQHIKPWYKQTPIWPMPDDWKIDFIKNQAIITTWNKNTQDKINDWKYPFYVRSPIVEHINSYSFDTEWVVTAWDWVWTWKVFHYVRWKFWLHQRAYLIYNFKDIQPKFFFWYFSKNFYNRVMSMTAKSSVDSVRKEMIEDMIVPIPPLPEQEAIANILWKVDETIEKTQNMIEKLELRNKWLIQQLVSWKLRLKWFSWSWKLMRFKDIFIPFKEKAWNNNYELLSVTKDGIYSQREYFNKEISSDNISEYLVIKKWDFAMSGLNFWMWSAHMLYEYEAWIISPAYKTFHIKNENVYTDYMRFFIESSSMRRALVWSSVQWASIVRRNLDSEMLENRQFSIPTLEEQKAIANVLNKATKQLDLYKQKLEKLQELKKWLMQQLLTWKVRVKEFRN